MMLSLVSAVVLTSLCVVTVSGCSRRIVTCSDADKGAKEWEDTWDTYYYNDQEITLRQVCERTCDGDWEPWSSCSQRCGGGRRSRGRPPTKVGSCKNLHNFNWPKVKSQEEACNTGCPHGGYSDAAKKGCRSCPTGRNGNCCETTVTCPHISAPSSGDFRERLSRYIDGTVITFTCDDEYTLIGNTRRTCGGNGKWSGSTPTCKKVVCTQPKKNIHVVIHNPDPTGYTLNKKVFYDCDSGYELHGELEGDSSRVCLSGQEGTGGKWSRSDPTCQPKNCGDPGIPENGQRTTGTLFTYGSELHYSCNVGHHMEGYNIMKCLSTGRWDVNIPQCNEITCDEPLPPINGEVTVDGLAFGTLVTFQCKSGYNLVGNTVLQCSGQGEWNGTEPYCHAVSCDNPGIPDHGSKGGSRYVYPHNVTFSCHAGHVLSGERMITCQSDGRWSAVLPSCEPCAISTYMTADTDGEEISCFPCPAHTHTVTNGSTTVKQCTCVEGYEGEPGGPCTEIYCPQLQAPIDGSMTGCQVSVGGTCNFVCNDGYIMERGSSVRNCNMNGQWDGKEPSCAPCKKNTFKSDDRSCLPCPQKSHTTAEAQMSAGCRCDEGYQGPNGGPCEDTDECQVNDGRGPCQDECENYVGSYRCRCSIPGYVLDRKNEHNCVVESQCQNLTEADAPDNGGLVCHWYHEHNSQQCTAMCNDGYEFPSRSNAYASCGPQNNYEWTFRIKDPHAVLHPCLEEFFPGYRSEANSAYFTRDCQDLSETEQLEVKETFAETLNTNGVCQMRGTKVCDIKDMAIICGRRTIRRRKRGVMEELSSMDLAFNVTAFQFRNKQKDCPDICKLLRIPDAHCSDLCQPTYKRFLKAAVELARRQLQQLYRDQERMKFRAASREFEPEEDGITTSEVISECKDGHAEVDGSCIPCERGSYYSNETQECVACPIGTYQLFEAQTSCRPCPDGSTTHRNGSVFCTACDGNLYGPMCEMTCHCVHGTCDSVTGECLCENGWEGDQCDTDIPGCRDGGCYDGVVCHDVPAPGSGFHCGACPAGLTGDGQSCTANSLTATPCQTLSVGREGHRVVCGKTAHSWNEEGQHDSWNERLP